MLYGERKIANGELSQREEESDDIRFVGRRQVAGLIRRISYAPGYEGAR